MSSALSFVQRQVAINTATTTTALVAGMLPLLVSTADGAVDLRFKPGGIMRALRSIPVMVDIARAVEAHAPDAMLLNVSNPLSALCRAMSKETIVTTVGLCNEMVGFQFAMSLIFECGMHEVKPTVAGVNHLPLVTSFTIGDDDGFSLLRDFLENPGDRANDPIWMNPPPPNSHWHKHSDGEKWTKSDVVLNNAVKLELFQRFGVLPGASDTHVVEFFPGFVTPESDFGRTWGVHHYGIAGHKADKDDDDDKDLKRIGLELNPLGFAIGRYSINVEYMLARHHALILTPFYDSTTVTVWTPASKRRRKTAQTSKKRNWGATPA